MPLYNPQITISSAPGITDYLRLALYEATAPNAEVASSGQLAPPHNASRQLQFLSLNPVIHIAKLFVTDGISTTGTVIANFSIDPRYPGIELKAPWFIYAGVTDGFVVGANVFTDPTGELDGWDFDVDIRGMGRLNPETELDKTPPGYEVLIPDYQLQPDELHIISFTPNIITYAPVEVSPNLFTSLEILTTDTALDVTDNGKQLFIQSATSTITITLPEIDSVPEKKMFWFTSQGGNHVNAVIQVEGSDSEKIDWLGGNLTEIILGQSEFVWIIKWIDPDDITNRRWKVLNCSEGPARVGETVYGNKYLSTDLINCVQLAGQLLDRDVYPRLWEWVQGLDVTQLVSDAVWNSGSDNKARFSTGDGSTTFRLPQIHNTGFQKAVDGTLRRAGSLQAQSNENLYVQFDPNVSQDFYMNKTTVPAWSSNWLASDSEGDAGSAVISSRTTGLTVGSLGTGTIQPANTGIYALIRI